jgi:hypothetical protein
MRSPMFLAFEISLSYDVFDFGKPRAAVRKREVRLGQAQVVTLRTGGERIAENQVTCLLAPAELEQTIGQSFGQ